jgi:hypothetical protein
LGFDLSSITRGPALQPPRMVLYGPHGIGKTSFGAAAPGAILLPFEEGRGRLEVPAFPLVKSWDDAMEALGTLYTEQHEFGTAVVDTLDWLEPIVWAETCRRNKWADIEEPGFGKGYVAADEVWREFFEGLLALRRDKGMSVILLAHCEIKQFTSPDSEPYDRYQIKLQKRAAALVQEWADAVFFTNFRVYTSKTKLSKDKEHTRGVGTGERVLYTEERPSHYAKNRYGLPHEMPLDYARLQAAMFPQPAAQAAA